MSRSLYFTLLIGVTALLGLHCNEPEEPFALNYSYNYFPMQSGIQWEYDIERITWDEITQKSTTSNYQFKMVVDDPFEDNEGRPSYRILTYTRSMDTASWAFYSTWYSTVTQTRAEMVEDNLRFIKMIFPIHEDDTWQGNLHLDYEHKDCTPDYEGWNYQVGTYRVPNESGGQTFENTITIEQVNDTTENLLNMKYATETYAWDVGLIKREFWYLETQDISFNHWKNKAQCGEIITWTLTKFTNE